MECASIDVVRTRTRREAAGLLCAVRAADVPGRVLLGALYAGGVTWADVPPRFQPRFVRDSYRSIATQHRHPGLRASFGSLHIRLGALRGFTVSCWRDLASMADWAYRDRVHREAMAWFESHPAQLRSRAWFGRFVVERSEGSLAGRDPFATRA